MIERNTPAVARRQAAGLIALQLDRNTDHTPLDLRPKGNARHYGVQELRELLDFIYGGPPANKSEEID